MKIKESYERFSLKNWLVDDVEGPLKLPENVFEFFLAAPYDILPSFQGPPGSTLVGGRGKDHPRYGRFIYSLAKAYKPEVVVEVGTYAGGTSIGWVKAMSENRSGHLICVDNDTYSKNTYPGITRQNLQNAGATEAMVEFQNGDSKVLLPRLAQTLREKVDIYLVDGDHTYEGALADIENGLPMMKPGSLLLVHDIDPDRRMDEMTDEHPHPVYEAFHHVIKTHGFKWCTLKFIRKHLGIIQR